MAVVPYVYIYLDPRNPKLHHFDEYVFLFRPYYVGISTTLDRIDDHLRHINSKRKRLRRPANSALSSFNQDIVDSGYSPIKYKLLESTKIDLIYKTERLLIKKLGKSSEGGLLLNMRSGGKPTT